jgi:heme-degrading monooxygenase HmoA
MDGGWRILSLWESREAFQAFLDQRLKPALEGAGRSQPQFTFWDIETTWQPGSGIAP